MQRRRGFSQETVTDQKRKSDSLDEEVTMMVEEAETNTQRGSVSQKHTTDIKKAKLQYSYTTSRGITECRLRQRKYHLYVNGRFL